MRSRHSDLVGSAFERELRLAHWPRSAAELATLGVTPARLRRRSWRRTSRGYYAPVTETAPSTAQRILDRAPLVPSGGAFSSWAAAYVLGVDMLDGLDSETLRPEPICISLGSDAGRASTTQIRYVRDRLPVDHRQVSHGLPVTTPFRTAFDGARWAPNLVEAVVFVDQVAHALEFDILSTLADWCAQQGKWPGAVQLREALNWADAASASPWESRLRMFYVLTARLPRPLVNQPIFDLDGRFVATPDLFAPEAGLATEFDGQDHRARRQHRADNIREEKLEGVNLIVSRVDSLDLRTRLALIDRLRSRCSQGLDRDRSQDNWTLEQPAWWRRRKAS